MINVKNTMAYLVLVGLTGLVSLPRDANAIPTLQLGIAGGTYDFATQTVVSTSPSFSLYAYLLPNPSNLRPAKEKFPAELHLLDIDNR